jgi:hypothetical protein
MSSPNDPQVLEGRVEAVHGMLVTVATDSGVRHRCRPPAEARSPGARDKARPDADLEAMGRDLARHNLAERGA